MKTLNDLRDRLTAEMAAAQARLSMVAAVEAFAGDVRAMGLNVVVEVYPTNVWIDVYLDESGQGVPTNPEQDRVFAEGIEALNDTLSPTCDPAAEFLTELPDDSDLGEDYDALIETFDASQGQFDAQNSPEYSVSDLDVEFPASQSGVEISQEPDDDTPVGFPAGAACQAAPPPGCGA